MKIKLEELKNSPEGKITLDFCEKIEELPGDKKVKGTVTASLKDFGVKIEGQVETDLSLQCDRCLKTYSFHVDVNINEKLVNYSLTSEGNKEIELKHDELTEELGNRTEIDITDLVYQNITLNIPYQKLCDENCEGIENTQKQDGTDPRLKVFKDFWDKDK